MAESFGRMGWRSWFAAPRGPALPVPTTRSHSFSDAILLVGFQPLTTLPDAGKILLQNDTATLGSLIGSLVSTIKDITTLNSDSTTGVVSAASQLALSEIADQLGALLQ